MAEIKVMKDSTFLPVRTLVNPVHIIRSLYSKRELILQFTGREVAGKYKGSYIGVLWSFITPLIMLCIYTFVFSFIFKARWGLEGKASILKKIYFPHWIIVSLPSTRPTNRTWQHDDGSIVKGDIRL
jgi:ABC-type polysaccharide/polyol phosphate export permease